MSKIGNKVFYKMRIIIIKKEEDAKYEFCTRGRECRGLEYRFSRSFLSTILSFPSASHQKALSLCTEDDMDP